MLFTVYHIIGIFLKKGRGFSRDSISSALLLFPAGVGDAGVLEQLVQLPWDPHGAGPAQAIPQFHISSSAKREQTSCDSFGAAATPGTAGRWEISSQNPGKSKLPSLGHQNSAAGDETSNELPVQRIPGFLRLENPLSPSSPGCA